MTVVTQYPSSNSAIAGGGLSSPTNAYADDSSLAQGTVTAVTTSKAQSYGTFGFDSALSPFVKSFDQVLLEVGANERRDAPPTDASHAQTRVTPVVSGVSMSSHTEQDAALTTRQYDLTASRAWVRGDFLDGVLAVQLAVDYIDAQSTGFFDFVRWVVTFTEGHPPRHAAAFYYPPVAV